MLQVTDNCDLQRRLKEERDAVLEHTVPIQSSHTNVESGWRLRGLLWAFQRFM